ncbi:hypothetical protein IBX73_06595 [candidate division WOR-3 bacterium]|nr:hypothetical protein [candidate division WOR-3 bacterium]
MDKETLNGAAAKGLPMPFSATASGVVLEADPAAAYHEQIAQMATVIFETLEAVGEVKIENIEIGGSKKSIIMDLHGDSLIGTIAGPPDITERADIRRLLDELHARTAPGPAARRTALVDPGVLEKIKKILSEYVGDFTERIFRNQLKNQNINVDELHEEDVRRVILALSKATGMIVGRAKGREMSKRLIDLVK